ncbi:MAG: thiamine diphosphokinase [Blautia sp.]|nr:thiamine diphosphokinase [Blautia sp.]
MTDTVIVSGGNIQTGFALDFLEKLTQEQQKKELLLIAADKGLEFFMETGIVPDAAVGDFDSLSEKGKEYLACHSQIEVKKLRPEKDDSDTQCALYLAEEKGGKNILLLGATGTRLDHVIANMELLLLGKKRGLTVAMADRNNYISLIDSGFEIKRTGQFGKYISFFPMGGDVRGLTLEGFKYPLDRHYLTASDSGLTVSNEIMEDTGKVTFESGNLLMIMSRD